MNNLKYSNMYCDPHSPPTPCLHPSGWGTTMPAAAHKIRLSPHRCEDEAPGEVHLAASAEAPTGVHFSVR